MILVDWGNGSGFPYNQATANTRVVGAEVAVLVSSLNRVLGTTNSQYHLIGHSLGAHIAGYAGSRLPGLGRITGNQYYWILSWDLNYPDELFIIGLRVRKKYYVYLQYLVIQGLIRLNQIIRILMTRYGWIRVMLFSWTLSTLMALITTQYQVWFKIFSFDTKIHLLQQKGIHANTRN